MYTRAYAAKCTAQETYEHSDILIELCTLAEGEYSFGDEVMTLYEEALDLVMPHSGKTETWATTLGKLRWHAVKYNPKDVEMGIHHFSVCLSRGDLKHSQQVCPRVCWCRGRLSPSPSYLFHDVPKYTAGRPQGKANFITLYRSPTASKRTSHKSTAMFSGTLPFITYYL